MDLLGPRTLLAGTQEPISPNARQLDRWGRTPRWGVSGSLVNPVYGKNPQEALAPQGPGYEFKVDHGEGAALVDVGLMMGPGLRPSIQGKSFETTAGSLYVFVCTFFQYFARLGKLVLRDKEGFPRAPATI